MRANIRPRESCGGSTEHLPSFDTGFDIFAMSWNGDEACPKVAVGSIANEKNHVSVFCADESGSFERCSSPTEQIFAPTKLMWHNDRLCCSSVSLALYQADDHGKLTQILNMVRSKDSQAPMTSFDWNVVNRDKVAVCSVDTTCAVWNLEKNKLETQLIAHDKAVYDISFRQHESQFASVGADGSMRVFDQRNLQHSTIIYETAGGEPLLRLCWHKSDPNYLATTAMDHRGVLLIDFRKPGKPVATLAPDHYVNSFAWSPGKRDALLCGTEDGHCIVCDKTDVPGALLGSSHHIASFGTGVNQVEWTKEDTTVAVTAQKVRVFRTGLTNC